MRVLWFTYYPIAEMTKFMGLSLSPVSWIEASLLSLSGSGYKLGFCSTIDSDHKTVFDGPSGRSWCLAMGTYSRYRTGNKVNIAHWKEVIDEFKPDIIHLWGTEKPIWLDVISANKEHIPVVASIQGVPLAVAENYMGGLTKKEILAGACLIDRLKYPIMQKKAKAYIYDSGMEKRIMALIDGILTDNKWCAEQYQAMNAKLKVFDWTLPLRLPFYENRWDSLKAEPHSIMAISGFYPLKGLHTLFQALTIVKREIPDVKLYVPGYSAVKENSIVCRLRRSSYLSYLERLLKTGGIYDNVHFIGQLSAERMAERMAASELFVMPSWVENHSSSLREAMLVGMPVIASNVGSVPEFLQHGINGYIYEKMDVQTLAKYIIFLLSNREKCESMGNAAYQMIRSKYYRVPVKLENAYRKI